MKTMNEVLQEIREIVADILALELQEVTPAARFFEDLGGESIDVLELSFRCERIYGIKAEFQKIGAAVRSDDNGMLTAESLGSLRTKYKFLDLAAIEGDPRAERVTELLTVQAIARYVYEAFAAKEESGAAQTAAGLSPA
jgi:acyl carrier protein